VTADKVSTKRLGCHCGSVAECEKNIQKDPEFAPQLSQKNISVEESLDEMTCCPPFQAKTFFHLKRFFYECVKIKRILSSFFLRKLKNEPMKHWLKGKAL
jgi:hypothetical protein